MTIPSHARISVLVVDSSDAPRRGLRGVLSKDPRFSVVTDTGGDAIAVAQRAQPDLIVVDPTEGADVDQRIIAGLRVAAPGARLVVFTAAVDPQAFMATMLHRVHGYLLKSGEARSDFLVEALSLIARFPAVMVDSSIAENFWSHRWTPVLVHSSESEQVTERERIVLQGLAAGQTEEQIAAAAGVTGRTVRRIVALLESQFDAASLPALTAKAAWLGPIPEPFC